MSQNDMSIYDHIGELRKRVIMIVVLLLVAMIGGFVLAPVLIGYLQSTPQAQDFPMNAFKLTDPIMVYVNFAFLTGLILIFPFLLYQLWAFVSPGLLEKERKATLLIYRFQPYCFLADLHLLTLFCFLLS